MQVRKLVKKVLKTVISRTGLKPKILILYPD